MLLAELIVRHTRRHMPTRRVALESAYLPTSGPAHGVALLAAVMATNLAAVDDDERDLLAGSSTTPGWSLDPRIALRHRLQRDVHGLDRSRHRLLGEDGRLVLELDAHGAQIPQVLGAVLGAAWLPSSGRSVAIDALRSVVKGRWGGLAPDVEVRFVAPDMWDYLRPPLAAAGEWTPGGPPEEEGWRGVAADAWDCFFFYFITSLRIAVQDEADKVRYEQADQRPERGLMPRRAASRLT